MCLLKIKESIDTWEKHSGSNGYFDFIEGYMGREIKGNDVKDFKYLYLITAHFMAHYVEKYEKMCKKYCVFIERCTIIM